MAKKGEYMARIRNSDALSYFLKKHDDYNELNLFYESIDNERGFLRGEFRDSHFGIAYKEDEYLTVNSLGPKEDLDYFVAYFLRPVMYGEKPQFYYETSNYANNKNPIRVYEWATVKTNERYEAIINKGKYKKNIKIFNFEDLREKHKIKAKE